MILNEGSNYLPRGRGSGSPVFLFKDGFKEFPFGLVQLLCGVIVADGADNVIELFEG